MKKESNLVRLNKERRRPLGVRLWSRVSKGDGCWEWLGYRNPYGYGTMNYSGSSPRLVHRVSWELTFGPIPDGLFVLHRCDNRRCVRPDHLFLGTNADNMHDMDQKGRRVNANQKLTAEQRAQIPALVATGLTHRKIGERFGVKPSTISVALAKMRRAS